MGLINAKYQFMVETGLFTRFSSGVRSIARAKYEKVRLGVRQSSTERLLSMCDAIRAIQFFGWRIIKLNSWVANCQKLGDARQTSSPAEEHQTCSGHNVVPRVAISPRRYSPRTMQPLLLKNFLPIARTVFSSLVVQH